MSGLPSGKKGSDITVEDDVTFRLPALIAGNRIPYRLSLKGIVRYYAATVSKPKDPLVKREIAEVVMGVKRVHTCWPLLSWWCLFEKVRTHFEQNPD